MRETYATGEDERPLRRSRPRRSRLGGGAHAAWATPVHAFRA